MKRSKDIGYNIVTPDGKISTRGGDKEECKNSRRRLNFDTDSNEERSELTLSQQQERIISEIEIPSFGRKVVRVTAAAGTGKTTTLLHIAKHACELGHKTITYLTFNRESADDAEKKLLRYLTSHNTKIFASTIHSCAMRLNSGVENRSQVKIMNDGKMKSFIAEVFKDDINEYLTKCFRNIALRLDKNKEYQNQKNQKEKIEKEEKKVFEKIVYFLFKQLTQFCRSEISLKDLKDPKTWNRVYYPARLFHQRNKDFQEYDKECPWFADIIHNQWDEKLKHINSFDLEMKRAQLSKLEIPDTTCILLDETQDCDACQIDWIHHQSNLGKQLFLVGDAAQTIYSFRGAKSRFMMSIDSNIDLNLTKSWRFGSSIAKVANSILFAKEYSPQTLEWTSRLWLPYRIQGNDLIDDSITGETIIDKWNNKNHPITIIARKNATLFSQAIYSLTSHHGQINDSLKELSSEIMPKIHLNGRGKESGTAKFKDTVKYIEELYDLYKASQLDQTSIQLNKRRFPEFNGKLWTWSEFVREVKDSELNRYVAAIGIVEEFQLMTLHALDIFQRHVLSGHYGADEADIILSTVHAAKGMEWDWVQVCDDFEFQMEVKERDGRYQFNATSWGDEINLLYVACTRAKKLLSIPNFLVTFYRQCDTLHSNIHTIGQGSIDDEIIPVFGCDSIYECKKLWNELIGRFWCEMNIRNSITNELLG